MPKEGAYKIAVGSRENKAMFGYLEMNMGNSIVKGTLALSQHTMGGFIIFPNRTIAWGRRLIKGKPVKDRVIQPSDVDYSGEVEWMKWNAEGGSPIIARYKYGCSSLDYDYQVIRLQLPKFEVDEEGAYLQLPYGENKIFYDTEELKADFLQIHHENEDSPSKSPNAEGGMWREVKVFDTTKQEVKAIDHLFEAVKIIKEADSFLKLKVLQGVIANVEALKYDESKENSLYDVLILFAKAKPKEFIDAIDAYKRKVSEVFSMADSYKVFDLTKDGDIVLLQPAREILFTGIPAKGKDMIDWVFQNSLQPEVHEAVNKLFHLSAKFK